MVQASGAGTLDVKALLAPVQIVLHAISAPTQQLVSAGTWFRLQGQALLSPL